MKPIHTLLLTAILICSATGLTLASHDENPLADLRQTTETLNLSSSHPTILDEESMGDDGAVGDEGDEPGLTNNRNSTGEFNDLIPEEDPSAAPGHLSGPVNADLRGQMDVEQPDTANEPTDRIQDEAETMTPDSAEAGSSTANEETTPIDVPTLPAANLPAVEETPTPQPVEENLNDPAAHNPVTPVPVEGTSEEETEPENTIRDAVPAPVEKTNADADSTPAPIVTTSAPAIQAEPLVSTVAEVETDTHTEETMDDNNSVEPLEDVGTMQPSSPVEELAEQDGFLPKVSFLLKEFGKWLTNLFSSVDSLL